MVVAVPRVERVRRRASTSGIGSSTTRYEISGSLDQSRVQRQPRGDARIADGRRALLPAARRRPAARLERARRSAATPRSSGSARSAASTSCSSRRISGARRASRSTTSATCAAPTSSRGTRGSASSTGTSALLLQALPVEQQLVAVLETPTALPLEAAYNTNVHITFKNNWAGTWAARSASSARRTTTAPRAAGRPVRQDTYVAPWLFVGGDDRRSIVTFNLNAQPRRRLGR